MMMSKTMMTMKMMTMMMKTTRMIIAKSHTWTSSTSSTTGGVASRELEPVFTGFDWTDMGDGGLSRDPGSVLGAGLLFGNTFKEPQL